jgi:hypothetical protein
MDYTGVSADLSKLKFIIDMKHVIKFFALMTLVLFVAVSVNAQSATTEVETSETKKCDVTKCTPAMCDAMVKAGLCTKAEAVACKAKCASKSTKVASASVEKVGDVKVSSTPKASCSSAKSKTCLKKCEKKKVIY